MKFGSSEDYVLTQILLGDLVVSFFGPKYKSLSFLVQTFVMKTSLFEKKFFIEKFVFDLLLAFLCSSVDDKNAWNES